MIQPFKIVTIVGIRPALIRMHKLIELFDMHQKKYGYEHVFIHTGQHFDYELDGVFYEQMHVRQPDHNLEVGKTLRDRGGPTTFEYQMGVLFPKVAEMLEKIQPNLVVLVGDTNTELSSIVVSRYGIPIAHIEAGGRSFDWRMPEEKCRIVTDHLSDVCYPYLPRYRDILLSEGIEDFRIKVVGNIIYDAVEAFLPRAEESKILEEVGVSPGSFALVTLHREENTSTKEILAEKLEGLVRLAGVLPVVWPLMPRVKASLETFGLWQTLQNSGIIVTKPLGYLGFLKLQKYAKVVITDSGSVQEEALILGVPALVARQSTERPETLHAGASIMADTNIYENALVALALKKPWNRQALNLTGRSPSLNIFEDIMEKIGSGFFEHSRSYDWLKSSRFVREAYGHTSAEI